MMEQGPEDTGDMVVTQESYELPGADQRGEGATTTTQLAEQFPQIDMPLRVDPPASLKAPERVEALSRDRQIRDSAFSPHAFSLRSSVTQRLSEPTGGAGGGGGGMASGRGVPEARGKSKTKIDSSVAAHSQNQAPHKTAVSDYSMLAFSSQRAGKTQMEGQAYLAIAITLDNMQQYTKAIESYGKFLSVCEKMGDPVIEGLAYNCLGVDCMLMACPPSEGSQFEGVRTVTPESQATLKRAIRYHQRHLDIADDGGQFVAHTNLGLCLGLLEDNQTAAQHHQEALRVAIRLQSFSGQSIAAGNLGLLAMRQGDLGTAKACMDQHLHLVQSLKDASAETNAWTQLGHLANLEGDYAAAVTAYENASQIAEQEGEIGTLKRIICNIGVARGNAGLEDHMAKLGAFAAEGYGGSGGGASES